MVWVIVAIAAVVAGIPVAIWVIGQFLPRGHSVTRAAVVPAAPDKVWAVITDFASEATWNRAVKESRRIEDNLILGDLVLDGLPARPRGQTRIEVTFTLDASGMLAVRARDAQTGQEQRVTLDVLGAQSAAEVDAARARFGQLRR